jgi:hypothetical protein
VGRKAPGAIYPLRIREIGGGGGLGVRITKQPRFREEPGLLVFKVIVGSAIPTRLPEGFLREKDEAVLTSPSPDRSGEDSK